MAPLQRAVEVLEEYEAAFVETYGETTERPAEVTSQGSGLLDRLAAAERELAPPPPPPPPPVSPQSSPPS